MPNWDHSPPPDAARPGLRLTRTPAGRPFRGVVTCERLIGCATHYFNNRTIPCEAPGCAACDEGMSWRWHAYVSCIDLSSHEHVVFELTAAAASRLQEYQGRHGTLRGCDFQASRANNRHNGRVLVVTRPADLNKIALPDAPNIPAVMCHIWNIPTTAVYQRPDPDGRDRIKLNKDAPSAAHVGKPTFRPEKVPDGNTEPH